MQTPPTTMMMMMIACATAGAACAPELEIGDTELTSACVRADAVPFGHNGAVRAALPLAELEVDELPASASIALASVELTIDRGVTDFRFVDGVRVNLLRPGGRDDVVLVNEPVVATSSSLRVEPRTSPDVTRYMETSQLTLAVALSGEMPAAPWAADLALCFAIDGAVIRDR